MYTFQTASKIITYRVVQYLLVVTSQPGNSLLTQRSAARLLLYCLTSFLFDRSSLR
jgi:hypothetical protein